MKPGLVVARSLVVPLLAPLLAPSVAAAQECGPPRVSVGWTQPNNVAITAENAVRWPTDATLRIAYGGTWCPDESNFALVDKEGNGVPAQVRFFTPFNLVENAPSPLTVVEIDPIPTLEERADYFLSVRLPDDSLIPQYELEFRTRGGPMDPIGDFEGALAVEPAADRCDIGAFFVPLYDDIPACLVPTHLKVLVRYQPLDRPELAYAIYRVSSTPLDPDSGDPIEAEANNDEVLMHVEAGARDALGTGVPVREARVPVLYAPLPRRDCFTVRMLDEWGRERGDLDNRACIDLLPLAPCPDGCMGDECMIVFPEPNPFEVNDPIEGQECENLGLNGGPADRPVPPVEGGGGDGGGGGAGGEGGGGDSDAGAGGSDGGEGKGSGGGDGCTTVPGGPGGSGWLLLLLPLGLLRRRLG